MYIVKRERPRGEVWTEVKRFWIPRQYDAYNGTEPVDETTAKWIDPVTVWVGFGVKCEVTYQQQATPTIRMIKPVRRKNPVWTPMFPDDTPPAN